MTTETLRQPLARPLTQEMLISNFVSGGLTNYNAIKTIKRELRKGEFEDGDVIVNQGEFGDRMYFIAWGKVKVKIMVPGSEEQRTVASLNPGEFFGEIALFTDGIRTASVIADSDEVILYALPKSALERLKESEPEFVQNIEKIAQDRQDRNRSLAQNQSQGE